MKLNTPPSEIIHHACPVGDSLPFAILGLILDTADQCAKFDDYSLAVSDI